MIKYYQVLTITQTYLNKLKRQNSSTVALLILLLCFKDRLGE
ncbi:hypothetical protein VCRA2122O12_240002 [Vibrio crassostreae]|nr:hypothetical protein VCRA2110O1_240002 [Vibrio crassostreae]CAK1911013.1 hypothetical protein VCRA2110O4_240002 [Vibrio crassostreae]CAK2762113.1 hypothetical protein VCRA2122O10_230002 [Vibrio crassostreae]CAK2842003.1 hypothetical protein VCRA2127O15_210083 [Vibrio crassostreae]CAK3319270.1 hypothetical protein VCRA2122O11_210002 [Vibrio crassostreae]